MYNVLIYGAPTCFWPHWPKTCRSLLECVHLVGQICNNCITMHRVKNVKFCSEVFNSQWSTCMENVCARLHFDCVRSKLFITIYLDNLNSYFCGTFPL